MVPALIARTTVNAKSEANYRRRRRIHHAGRGRNVNHARRRLDVHHLRRGLNNLNLLLFVTRLRRINHLSVRNGRRVLDHRRWLAIDLLAINRRLINGRRRVIHRFPGGHNRPDQTASDGANHGTFRPAVAIMTTNQAARDSTNDCAAAHGRPVDLRLGRTNARQRDGDSDKKCFHFDSSDECERPIIQSIYRTRYRSRTNSHPAKSAMAP